jgi:hypothetical protein
MYLICRAFWEVALLPCTGNRLSLQKNNYTNIMTRRFGSLLYWRPSCNFDNNNNN